VKQRKIITILFNDKLKEKLENIMFSIDLSSTIVHLDSVDSINEHCDKQSVLFYFSNETAEVIDVKLKSIRNILPLNPLNICFKKKDFRTLANAFQYDLNNIFEDDFDVEEIKTSLVKSDLVLSKQNRGIPEKALDYLWQTPIKVKSDDHFYSYLKNYLDLFLEANNLCFWEQIEDHYELFLTDSEVDEKLIISELKKIPILPESIGTKFNRGDLYFVPIYIKNSENILWASFNYSGGDVSELLNEYFFKFLENLHLYRKIKDKQEKLEIMSHTDDVTGLFNQRRLALDLRETIKDHEEREATFSVMFVDVDHFKKVNDNYGHVVGSQMLTRIGNEFKHLLRSSDNVYRYGGDEFVTIMRDIDIKVVKKIALRILRSVKNINFELDNGDIYKLSISIGIAEYPTDAKSAKEMIEFADKMMYESKKSGRGKVFHLTEVAHALTRS